MGIERVVAWICGLHHLREAIPYPRMLYRLLPVKLITFEVRSQKLEVRRITLALCTSNFWLLTSNVIPSTQVFSP